jgi:outer membrane protein assembly factor BamB
LFTLFLAALLAALFLAPMHSEVTAQDWPQWGGPNRDFTTGATGLASTWPSGGPRQAWSRNLGEGYSAIVVEGNRVYTMYREKPGIFSFGKEDQEVVVALNASDGKTIWEHRYEAPELPRMNLEYGPGPHSAPLIVGNRIYTVGAMGHFFALDKNTGRPVWSHNLHQEFGVTWGRGYSCSPIAYKDTVILVTGKKGHSVIAFKQSDGSVAWKKQDFDYGPSSPILINVDGQEQLVLFMADGPVGLDPSNGELLWTHPHKTDWGLNISTPVWGPGNLLFLSSAYSGGSRVLHLTQKAGKTNVRQMWFSSRMRIHFGNAVRIGDYVYGSSGDFGPAFLAGVELKTGNVAWQDRSFSRASMVYADGKLIVLDEDGDLALLTVSPTGAKVLARASVLTRNTWTPPTLAGTRLYIRDRKTIRALELK